MKIIMKEEIIFWKKLRNKFRLIAIVFGVICLIQLVRLIAMIYFDYYRQ